VISRAYAATGHAAAEQRDEVAAVHVWMAPAWQEKMQRAAQKSPTAGSAWRAANATSCSGWLSNNGLA
jgi:hypothetical protein